MGPTMLRLNIYLSLTVITLVSAVNAFGQFESQGYLPLTSNEISRKFPVRYVGTVVHGNLIPSTASEINCSRTS